jgi:hypothetical protein
MTIAGLRTKHLYLSVDYYMHSSAFGFIIRQLLRQENDYAVAY